jgi:hypothetical protein
MPDNTSTNTDNKELSKRWQRHPDRQPVTRHAGARKRKMKEANCHWESFPYLGCRGLGVEACVVWRSTFEGAMKKQGARQMRFTAV